MCGWSRTLYVINSGVARRVEPGLTYGYSPPLTHVMVRHLEVIEIQIIAAR